MSLNVRYILNVFCAIVTFSLTCASSIYYVYVMYLLCLCVMSMYYVHVMIYYVYVMYLLCVCCAFIMFMLLIRYLFVVIAFVMHFTNSICKQFVDVMYCIQCCLFIVFLR